MIKLLILLFSFHNFSQDFLEYAKRGNQNTQLGVLKAYYPSEKKRLRFMKKCSDLDLNYSHQNATLIIGKHADGRDKTATFGSVFDQKLHDKLLSSYALEDLKKVKDLSSVKTSDLKCNKEFKKKVLKYKFDLEMGSDVYSGSINEGKTEDINETIEIKNRGILK